MIEQAFGMLCDANIASMAELLDPNGVWTNELLALMLPVAMDLQADRAATLFGASAAAVSLIGGKKGAEEFTRGIAKTKAQVRSMLRESRGLPPEKPADKPGESAAEQFMNVLGLLGIKAPVKKKPGPPGVTKKHKGK